MYMRDTSLHSAHTNASRVKREQRVELLQVPAMKNAIAAGTSDATRLRSPNSCCVRYKKSVAKLGSAAAGACNSMWCRECS